jgi:hypothetical protein
MLYIYIYIYIYIAIGYEVRTQTHILDTIQTVTHVNNDNNFKKSDN